MVIFMLLERRDLRDRLIGLFGHGRLTVTTKAFDEAGTRVSRQLLMQSLVNLVYGIVAGLGLYFLGVPYALVWARARCGAALHPVRRTCARRRRADPGQPRRARGLGRPALGHRLVRRARAVHQPRARDRPLCRRGGRLAGGAARLGGVLDVAVGAARPAHGDAADRVPRRARQARAGTRVRRHADGRHAGAGARSTATTSGCWRAIQSEAADLIERHIKTEPPRSVYDALLLPALNYAERDRLEQRLSLDEETAVIDATRELLPTRRSRFARLQPEPPAPRRAIRRSARTTRTVARAGLRDQRRRRRARARRCSPMLVDDLPIVVEITSTRMQASELVSLVEAQGVSVVCLADLPPSPPSKTRYLVKRLHAALPDVRILVGRWGPPALADESTQVSAGCRRRRSSPRRSRRPGRTWAGWRRSRGSH